MVKVSVIMPVYNGEKYLSQCLGSVTAQTLKDIEILCIDDGSQDKSNVILDEFAEKDPRIRVFHTKNAGAGAARNLGLSKAEGEYLSFLDADDVFEPDMLEKAYAAARGADADIVVFRADSFTDLLSGKRRPLSHAMKKEFLPQKEPFKGTDIKDHALQVFNGWAWDKLFRRAFILENGITYQEIRSTNDACFVFCAVLRAERIITLPDVLAHYRRSDDQLSSTREKSWGCCYEALVAIREQLQRWGMFERFEQDFVNYSAELTLWHLDTIHGPSYAKLYTALHDGWLADLGIDKHPAEYFYKENDYLRCMDIIGSEQVHRPSVRNRWKDEPVISVLMPSLNVARYIRECILSVLKQTREDMEIICIDAGSTDGTLEILQEYARNDPRMRVILSDRKSYGYQMNLGLDAARGKYIGIVETDDWAEPDMFEKLVALAEKNDADMVKSDFWRYSPQNDPENRPEKQYAKCPCEKVITLSDCPELMMITASIWSGIYRTEFLRKNGIRFNETKGASFQDMSFFFQVCLLAKRMYLTSARYLHYRIDNPNSSVKAGDKLFCVCDEAAFTERIMAERKDMDPEYKKIYCAAKYDKYLWNFNRVIPEEQRKFFETMQREFKQHSQEGLLSEKYFSLRKRWADVRLLVDTPESWYRAKCKLRGPKKYYGPADNELRCLVQNRAQAPEISVIIPVYNTEKYIGQTLESICDQTFLPLEILCIDDGSSDGSQAILTAAAAKDERISVYTQKNSGLATSRNEGIGFARGKYVYFMDSDDLLEKDALRVLYETMERDGLDVLRFAGTELYESKQLEKQFPDFKDAYRVNGAYPVCSGTELLPALQKNGSHSVSSCLKLFRREFLEKNRIRFPDGLMHEDNLFELLTVLYAERACAVKDAYFIRRIREDSIMTRDASLDTLLGYSTCFFEAMAAVENIKWKNDEERDAVYSMIKGMLFSSGKVYNALRPEEKKWLRDNTEPLRLTFIQTAAEWHKCAVAAKDMEKKYKGLRGSGTFKVLHALSYIPRKLKRVVKKLKK